MVLDPRLVGEGRAKEVHTLCGQEALFVVPRSAMRRGTKTVRGKLVEDMKGELVKSMFVAAEVARDVRQNVHAGTPALKVLRLLPQQSGTARWKASAAQRDALRHRFGVRARDH